MQKNEIIKKREIFSWCLFDFANSSYATVLITAIYPTFFVSHLAAGKNGDLLWGISIAAANVLVILFGPIMGTIADFNAIKKKFLVSTSFLCIITTAFLYFPNKESIFLAMVLVIISRACFSLTENFISSFLPEISKPKDMGKISGYAWALGYIGGVLSLIMCIIIINNTGKILGVKISMPATALFFALASLPTFIFLKERSKKKSLPKGKGYLSASFNEILKTFKNAKSNKQLLTFLLSFLFYSCGIEIVISFSAIYAKQELGFKIFELMILIIGVNLLASIGAFIFGYIQDKIGTKITIAITLVIWCVVIFGVFITKSKLVFYMLSSLVGISLGSTQSASRAMIGLLTKEGRFGEDFGLWGFSGKLASIIGGLSFGLFVLITGSRRIAILITLLYFVLGLVTLLMIKLNTAENEKL